MLFLFSTMQVEAMNAQDWIISLLAIALLIVLILKAEKTSKKA